MGDRKCLGVCLGLRMILKNDWGVIEVAKFIVKRDRGIVEEVGDEVIDLRSASFEKPREILRKAMKQAWMRPEMQPLRERLSLEMEESWAPEIEEALEKTGYREELRKRAEKINLSGRVKRIWREW